MKGVSFMYELHKQLLSAPLETTVWLEIQYPEAVTNRARPPQKRLSAIGMLKTALFADIVEIPYLPPGCQKAGGAFKLPLGPHSLAPLTPNKRPLLSDLCGGFWRSSIPSGGAGGGTRPPRKPQVPTPGLSAAPGRVAVLQDRSDWERS